MVPLGRVALMAATSAVGLGLEGTDSGCAGTAAAVHVSVRCAGQLVAGAFRMLRMRECECMSLPTPWLCPLPLSLFDVDAS